MSFGFISASHSQDFPNRTRHGCGPGAALPADTVTEGARLPRKTREELEDEFNSLRSVTPGSYLDAHLQYQRLADLAGQIAGMIAGMNE